MSIEVMRQIKVRAHFEPTFRKQLMQSPIQFLQTYDLTEEEKQQIILPNFDWLFKNKLAAMAYPESEDACTLLYQLGIRAILTLSETPLPYTTLNTLGMLSTHIPINDYAAPTLQQVEQAVTMISTCLEKHMPVVVHCIAGLGRTGTILACYLVKMEMAANNAIIIIREWRPGSIEGPDQESVIYEYEHLIETQTT